MPSTRPLTETATLRRREVWGGLALLFTIAVVGLFVVKWQPSTARALSAATTHSLGTSILTGTSAAPPTASLEAAWAYARAYFLAIWQAMLLGLLLAATIESSVPHDLLVRVFGRAGFGSSALGGLLSLPGMMCTCCSAPVALGLRRGGASLGMVTAFFMGNPTLNPAVLVFLLFTLGWQWAALRLVLGGLLVFGSALLAMRLGASVPRSADEGGFPIEQTPSAPWLLRWLGALARLVVQLVPEYVVIVGVLGFARAFLFPAATPELGDNLLVMLGLAVAGTLFVIPTAGEIPIIQTMLGFGVGAGPAGVLLLTLAPLSLPSLVMLRQVFPARVLVVLASLTCVFGLAAGLLAVLADL